MNLLLLRVVLLFILCTGAGFGAEDIITTRVQLDFPEAMTRLQETIKENGYTLSRVQRVDLGLEKSGYKTDKYQVVFYGHSEEVKTLSARYPELIPYLPHQIAIFAEDDETLLVATNPEMYISNPNPPAALQKQLKKWKKDLMIIFRKLENEE